MSAVPTSSSPAWPPAPAPAPAPTEVVLLAAILAQLETIAGQLARLDSTMGAAVSTLASFRPPWARGPTPPG